MGLFAKLKRASGRAKVAKQVEEILADESAEESADVEQGTFRFQKELPHLPIPSLEATCETFLKTVQAITTEAEMAEAKDAVQDFSANLGPEMQAELVDYAKDKDNYVDAFWDDAYLLMDDPVTINVNPFFVLEDDPTPARNEQIMRAASLLMSALKFVYAVRSESVEVDMVRGKPLCMSQFKKVIGSARIPHGRGPGNDSIVTTSDSTHIIVACRNQFYTLDVVDKSGELLWTHEQIVLALNAIREEADEALDSDCAENAFGVLTSETRSTWARYRSEIEQQSPHNARVLETIDSALFVLCLDDCSPSNLTEASANALRGTHKLDQDGVQVGTCMSRWYDKLQFIVAQNGSASVNFEHTPADGHTVLRMMSDVSSDLIVKFAQSISGKKQVNSVLKSVRFNKASESGFLAMPRKLELELSTSVKQGIKQAHSNLCELIDMYQFKNLEYKAYGSRFMKQNKFSPDAYVQQSMIASTYKVTGGMVNAYESVMTKLFLLGRTEAGRPATAQAKRYNQVLSDPGSSAESRVQALRDAASAHSKMTGQASQGLGVDRHLYALKCAWRAKHGADTPLPRLFSSAAYQKLSCTILSTSNCGNPALKSFGFGPVSADGIGIGYIIKENAITFSMCSKSIDVEAIERALVDYLDKTKATLKQESKRISMAPASMIKKFQA